MPTLKFAGYDIVFQEVPDEVSLALNITNCPYHCKGCHSSYLADDFGESVNEKLKEILDKYNGMITCVCFMGGDQAKEELIVSLCYVKSRGLKTCLYTGCNDLDNNDIKEIIPYLDYIKIGSYVEELGGLSNKNTNQRFYKIEKDTHKFEDITYRFQEKKY